MPGPTSLKNMLLSPAATDLGLGDALRIQVENRTGQLQKEATGNTGSGIAADYGETNLGLAAYTLGLLPGKQNGKY